MHGWTMGGAVTRETRGHSGVEALSAVGLRAGGERNPVPYVMAAHFHTDTAETSGGLPTCAYAVPDWSSC